MHFHGIAQSRIQLLAPKDWAFSLNSLKESGKSQRILDQTRESHVIARAAQHYFVEPKDRSAGKLLPRRAPSVFRDANTGLLRCFYREIVIRFKAKISGAVMRKHLRDHGLEFVRRSDASLHTIIARDPMDKKRGYDLIRIANRIATRDDDVVYSAPNFVSQYRRHAVPVIPAQQWHLDNVGYYPGQVVGQDVRAKDGWAISTGKAQIVVAVVDDGVDIDHPALAGNIWRNPDMSSPDECGRDFTSTPGTADFYNPRPKTFNAPYNDITQNDIHGTPCAGLIAANAPDGRAFGVAPGCKILPVKIFNGSQLISDEMVATAIRYASSIADVLSCAWDCAPHPATQNAIIAAVNGDRGGKGCTVFCSAGNGGTDGVTFPADLVTSIAVGSSTGDGSHASYSNSGQELSVVTPSGDGLTNVFTCDVSTPSMGFNPGDDMLGGSDGLYTNGFTGTSASVPIAAGVAAVVLSAYPYLKAAQLKDVLQKSADKVGFGYDAGGHSDLFGYGKVNLVAALNAAAIMEP